MQWLKARLPAAALTAPLARASSSHLEVEIAAWIDTGAPGALSTCMPLRKTRNASNTPELVAFVHDRLASGRDRCASEVMRAALRLPEEELPRASPAEQAGTPREAPGRA